MRKVWSLGLILFACLCGVVRGDDYVLVRSIPFPQPSNGGGTGITFIQGKIAFLTQKPGTEDIFLIDPRSGAVVTRFLAPAATVTGLADDGTILYAIDKQGIFGMDLLGRVTTVLPIVPGMHPFGTAVHASVLYYSTWNGLFYRLDRGTGRLLSSLRYGTQTLYGFAHDTVNLLAATTTEIIGLDDTTGIERFRIQAPAGGYNGIGYGDDGCLYVGNQSNDKIAVLAPVARPLGTLEIGRMTSLQVAAPIARGKEFAAAAALTANTGIQLPDRRVIPLDPDSLFFASFFRMDLFRNFQGVLDSAGKATISLRLPDEPSLRGTRILVAFVSLDPAYAGGIHVISAALQMTIR